MENLNCELDNNNNNKEIKNNKKPIVKKNIVGENKTIEDSGESEETLEARFMKSLPKDKLKFFMFKASQIYSFLKSINLVRYIEIFIEDGFEDLESVLGK